MIINIENVHVEVIKPSNVLSTFTILCWATFITILGHMWPAGQRSDTPALERCLVPPPCEDKQKSAAGRGTLISHFQPPELGAKNPCCLSASLWYLVTVTGQTETVLYEQHTFQAASSTFPRAIYSHCKSFLSAQAS